MNLEKLYPFIINKLSSELSPDLYYHSVRHTLDVYIAVERLAKSENLNENEIIILKTAALFHDIGFIKQYKDHEDVSVIIARNILPDFDYTEKEIDLITSVIMKTKLPQKAVSTLEKILCDADLDYLGRSDFFIISHKLRLEWEKAGLHNFNLKEWYQMQINFLSQHSYFTKSAIAEREKLKQQNIAEIRNLLNL